MDAVIVPTFDCSLARAKYMFYYRVLKDVPRNAGPSALIFSRRAVHGAFLFVYIQLLKVLRPATTDILHGSFVILLDLQLLLCTAERSKAID